RIADLPRRPWPAYNEGQKVATPPRCGKTRSGQAPTATRLSRSRRVPAHTPRETGLQLPGSTGCLTWHWCCSSVCACEGVPWGDAGGGAGRPRSRRARGRGAFFFWAAQPSGGREVRVRAALHRLELPLPAAVDPGRLRLRHLLRGGGEQVPPPSRRHRGVRAVV